MDISVFLTAHVTLVNLASEDVTVTVSIVDPDTGKLTKVEDLKVEPLGFAGQNVPPTDFVIAFSKAGAKTPYATCHLTVQDQQTFDFAALDDAVAVALRGSSPTQSADLWVDTSRLCQKQGG